MQNTIDHMKSLLRDKLYEQKAHREDAERSLKKAADCDPEIAEMERVIAVLEAAQGDK